MAASNNIRLISLSDLKIHEETDNENYKIVKLRIENKGCIEHPIIVDFETKTVLDGHHRLRFLKENNFSKAPVILVDYFDKNIELLPRRCDISVSKKDVIKRALSGNPYPCKTTKHILPNELGGITSFKALK